MTDGLSNLYRELLSGSYDCVDRIGDRLKLGGVMLCADRDDELTFRRRHDLVRGCRSSPRIEP